MMSGLEVISTLIASWMGWTVGPPQACPSVQAIQEVPLLVSKRDDQFYTKQISKFDTREKWVFIVYHFSTTDPADIFKTATATLKTLQGSPVPIYTNKNGWGNHWYCSYQNKFGYETFAKTMRSKSS